RVVAPLNNARHLMPLVWGLLVRDSSSSCLPFSVVGGFVLGVRAATLHGISWSVATLSMVVDLTAEFLAEIAFTVAGLLILLARSADASLTKPIVIGLAVALVASGLVLRLQKGVVPLLVRFGRKILGDWFAHRGDHEVTSEHELVAMYGHTGRMALGTAIHLVGWLCKGIGNWIAFSWGLWQSRRCCMRCSFLPLWFLGMPECKRPGMPGSAHCSASLRRSRSACPCCDARGTLL